METHNLVEKKGEDLNWTTLFIKSAFWMFFFAMQLSDVVDVIQSITDL